MATIEEISANVIEQQGRFLDLLFATSGLSEDGIQNLSDLKEEYGRKNGELWQNNFVYGYGEIATINEDIYISNSSNNLNNVPGDSTQWDMISSKDLSSGSMYTGAFANIRLETTNFGAGEVILNAYIENGLNIASVSNLSPLEGGAFDVPQSVIINVDFGEGANINDENYVVLLCISRSGPEGWNVTDEDSWPAGYKDQYFRPRGPLIVGKTQYGFTFSTDSFDQEISVVILPKQ